MTNEEIKKYLQENLKIGGFYSYSECSGQSITVSLYLENEKIDSCSIDLY